MKIKEKGLDIHKMTRRKAGKKSTYLILRSIAAKRTSYADSFFADQTIQPSYADKGTIHCLL